MGDVVRLREETARSRPLAGRRVLVTRPEEQAREMVGAIALAGGEPVLVPMVALHAPESWAAVDRAIAELERYDAVLFTSANAVRYFARRARETGRDVALDALRGRVVCVGARTARAAGEAGLDVAWVGRSDAGSLLEELASPGLEALAPGRGRRYLLPVSALGRDVLPDGLRAAGAEVDEVVTYRNTRPDVDAGRLRRELCAGDYAALTFASPSAVHHLTELLDAESKAAMTRCTLAAIGSSTAEALRAAGFEVAVVPERPGGPELIAALAAHFAGTPAR